ncbi:MAG: transglutaminase domain-containing protein [Nanoarchaeota archaeon]
MKKIIFILIFVILIVGCSKQISKAPMAESVPLAEQAQAPQTELVSTPELKIENQESPSTTNPLTVLSDALVQKLGAECKSKTSEMEKANCLLDWQEKNIHWCYTHPEETVMPKMFESGYPDCVVDMQFQQMNPGSFPVSKIFELKLKNSKLFGACYTYAVTYCALARWNGLTCRVMEVQIITPMDYSASGGDYGPDYCGAAPKSYLDALGLDCEEWKVKNWIINYDHYWAEVLIDGQWKIMERPAWAYQRDTQKYIIDAGRNYLDTGW